jgi:N-methylhydantoinase B
VIAEDGSVDTAATESLRAQLREARGEIPLFNRGGSIDELKARCEAETHLKPPVSPSFRSSAA